MSFEIRTLCLSVPSVVAASVRPSGDAVLESSDVEVHQQPHFLATQLQIRNQLRLMERDHLLNGFQLNDDSVFYKNVDPIANIQFHFVINHRQSNLTQRFKPTFPKLINQTGFIGRFQKARPEASMNLNGSSYDFRSERVVGFRSVRIYGEFGSTTEPKPRTTEIF